jgi:Uncharacterized NAD(FAD)-dependent dehydrogenases
VRPRGVVIVGTSVAGVKTAEALRSGGFEEPVVLIGAEDDLPYDKPALSKQVLLGTSTEAQNLLLSQEAADAAGIELRLGNAAVRLEVHEHFVELKDGARVGYDSLVIATGVRARPSPWGQPPGVHLVRTIADVRGLRRDVRSGGRLVVVGGSFIGSEVAAAANAQGMTVTVVDPAPVPMGRVLGAEIGEILSQLHPAHGVETIFGMGVSDVIIDPSVRTAAGHSGLTVHLDDGTLLPADAVVIGIGTIPNDEWLLGSGLVIDNGVVCDEFSRARGTTDVYAAGDVARWFHPRHQESVRVEHWTTAVEHAQNVAHNISHPDDLRPFSPVEYIWSDQYDWKIQMTGRTGAVDYRVLRDDGRQDRFAVLYSTDGVTFSGAMTANWPKLLLACRRAVGTGVTINELEASLGTTQRRPRLPSMTS